MGEKYSVRDFCFCEVYSKLMKTNDKKLKIEMVCENFNLIEFSKFLDLVFGEKEINKMWGKAGKSHKRKLET
jgi:hypothetical protein